ncbi:MAG: hypothetical protein DELT_01699 [Desulfovibrio sp.]
MQYSPLLDRLAAELPPIIVRSQVGRLTGMLVTPKTLSNADSAGLGPKEKEMVANKIVYSRTAFIQWLHEYFASENNSQQPRGEYVQRR